MTLVNSTLKSWRYARRIWDSFGEHSGGLIAAAIAFYGLLSLVPLLSLAIAVLGWVVGGSEEALRRTEHAIQLALPGSSDLIYEALGRIKQDSGIAGSIGIGGLLLASSAIFGNLELAFSMMWHTPNRRKWWQSRLVSLAATVATLILMFTSVGITAALTWAQNIRVPGLGPNQVSIVWQVAGYLAPLGLSILMFAVIYRIVPNQYVSWRCAFCGGIFAGAAWELAKYLFALYVSNYANYDKVYGSLGAIVSLMFWAYYSSTILLLGAEIAAAGEEKPGEHSRGSRRRSIATSSGRT